MYKNWNTYYLFLLLWLLPCLAFSQNKEKLNEKNMFSVLSENLQEIEILNIINNYETIGKESEGKKFVEISISDDYLQSTQTGKPALPIIQKLIEIPVNATVKIEIEECDSTIYFLDPNWLYPVQASTFKNRQAAYFQIDSSVYSKNKFYSLPLIQIENLGQLRGTVLGKLTISPVSYNPYTKQIRVYTKLKIRVIFQNADFEKTIYEKKRTQSFLENKSLLKLLNKKSTSSLLSQSNKDYPIKYVIVAPDSFKVELQPFIQWKRQKGFEVIEAYTSNSIVGTTKESIKNYLSNLYFSATPINPAPNYLLIVGDTPQIPSFVIPRGTYTDQLGAHFTDLYYAEYTNDIYPELFYGRISARSKQELKNILDKSLNYEKCNLPNLDYLKNVLLVAGKETSEANALTTTNGQINYLKDTYFDTNTFTASYYYNGESHLKFDEIKQKLNAGSGLVNYTSHCLASGWVSPNFNKVAIDSLKNSQAYFFSVNNCCLSNKFDEPECFGEALLKKPNSGAIGVIGAANETLWAEDFYWAVGAKTTNLYPSYQEHLQGAFDRFFHNQGQDIKEWYQSMGEMLQAGNLAITQSGSFFEKYYWEIYNLLGDPSLSPFVGIPQELTLSFPDSIKKGSSEINFIGLPYSYVSITAHDSILGVCTLNENGTGTLVFNKPLFADSVLIVATKQFHKPFIQKVGTQTPLNACLIVSDFSITNQAGNAIEKIKNGETCYLKLCIENIGSATDSGSLSLTSSSGNINFTSSLFEVPTLATSEKYYIDSIKFTANQNIEDLSIEKLLAKITSTNSNSQKEICLLASAPFISFQKAEIKSNPLNNKQYDIGLTLKNSGSNSVSNLKMLQTNNCQNIEIQSGTIATIPFLEKDSCILVTFSITLLENANSGVLLDVNFITDSGFFQNKSISFTLNPIIENFESGNFEHLPWNKSNKNTVWEIESNPIKVFNGSYCARSPKGQQHFTNSTLSISINTVKADSLSFNFRVSSEEMYDKLSFYINGQEKESWSGEIGWKKAAYFLEEGTYTLQWVYSKDVEGSEGEDAAWLDDIVFPPFYKDPQSIEISDTKTYTNNDCKLYPIPANDQLFIEFTNKIPSNCSFELYNAMGKKVKSGSLPASSEKNCYVLNTLEYSNGLYLLILHTEKNNLLSKFLILH